MAAVQLLCHLFEALSTQAEAAKTGQPVAKLYEVYQQALSVHHAYMEGWKGRLLDNDLSGRTLEPALESVERRCSKVHI